MPAMNTKISLEQLLQKVEKTNRTNISWKDNPDALADALEKVLKRHGYCAQAIYHPCRKMILVSFHVVDNQPTYASLELFLNPSATDNSDIISNIFNTTRIAGTPINQKQPLWNYLKTANAELVDIVRNIAYDKYLRIWQIKHVSVGALHRSYANNMLNFSFGATNYSPMPSVSAWAKDSGWGIDKQPKSMSEFLQTDYREDGQPWANFPDNWMRVIWENDVKDIDTKETKKVAPI